MLVLEYFNGGTRSFLCWVFVSLLALWHRKVEPFLACKFPSVWISGTRVLQGLALNPTECRRVQQLDCKTACICAVRLQDCVQSRNRAVPWGFL